MNYSELPSSEFLHSIFRYEASTGKLFWKCGVARRIKAGDEAGWKSLKYLQVTIQGIHYYVHRIIWKMVVGAIPVTMQVDHIDGDTTNNRWDNLRLVYQFLNMKNQSIPINNVSGVIGVSFHSASGLWQAKIGHNGKKESSYHKCKDAAILWRKQKEMEYGFHACHGRTKPIENRR